MRILIVRKKIYWEWIYKDLRDIWGVSWLNFLSINFLLAENICLSSDFDFTNSTCYKYS